MAGLSELQKVNMSRLLLTIVLSVISTSVLAEWTLVNSEDSFESYVNLDTIRKDGDKAKIWNMINYKVRNGRPYLSESSLLAFDCKEETLRVLSLNRFKKEMGMGEVTSSDNSPGELVYVSPGSYGEKLLKTACGKK